MADWRDLTWEDLADIPEQTVLATGEQGDVRWLIKRSGWSLCGYVGVALPHPAAEFGDPAVEVHGGFTFGPYIGSMASERVDLERDWVWWGWDYSHAGDQITWPKNLTVHPPRPPEGKRWTPAMVHTEIMTMLPMFHRWLDSMVERNTKMREDLTKLALELGEDVNGC